MPGVSQLISPNSDHALTTLVSVPPGSSPRYFLLVSVLNSNHTRLSPRAR
jgi:hypothetical protein